MPKLLYRPAFFDEGKAEQNYVPDISGAYREGLEFAQRNTLCSAEDLREKGILNALLSVDPEKDFCDEGRLGTRGANQAILNIVRLLINGTVEDFLSYVVESKDIHGLDHVSFDTSWVSAEGSLLDLRQTKAARMELKDESSGEFSAYQYGADGAIQAIGTYYTRYNVAAVIRYAKFLKATNQGDIWVFNVHCVEGTDGVETHPLLAEAHAFYAGARQSKTVVVRKGYIADRDWFGMIHPCLPIQGMGTQYGYENLAVADVLETYDRVLVGGLVEDFCVDATVAQLMEHFGEKECHRISPITDATVAIVPNAPHVAERRAKLIKCGGRLETHDSL